VTRLSRGIRGFQGDNAGDLRDNDRVLATAKHDAGDGDTEFDTAAGDYTIDQGVTITSREDFARIDLAPYVAAVRRHKTGTVMPSFSSVDWTERESARPVGARGLLPALQLWKGMRPSDRWWTQTIERMSRLAQNLGALPALAARMELPEPTAEPERAIFGQDR
jgi:Glycosyl hydrolase family 3 N terminal domain